MVRRATKPGRGASRKRLPPSNRRRWPIATGASPRALAAEFVKMNPDLILTGVGPGCRPRDFEQGPGSPAGRERTSAPLCARKELVYFTGELQAGPRKRASVFVRTRLSLPASGATSAIAADEWRGVSMGTAQ